MVEGIEQLLVDIKSWVSGRRESTRGGWAAVTPDDVEELSNILNRLIRAKCEPDADGDVPIQFTLVDRVRYWPLHFVPVPYDHDASLEMRFQFLLGHWLNLSLAFHAFEAAMSSYQHFRREDEASQESTPEPPE